jgi:hypothetical protein
MEILLGASWFADAPAIQIALEFHANISANTVESRQRVGAIMYNVIQGSSREAGTDAPKRSVVALGTITTFSSALMLLLLWRYPLPTSIVTMVILAVLFLLARAAKRLDSDKTTGVIRRFADRESRNARLSPNIH